MFQSIDNTKKSAVFTCEENRFENTIIRLKEMEAEFLTIAINRDKEEKLHLVYYFRKDEKILVLKVDAVNNSIPSLYSTFKKADFIEREINNLFGLKFLGHPNLERVTGETPA